MGFWSTWWAWRYWRRPPRAPAKPGASLAEIQAELDANAPTEDLDITVEAPRTEAQLQLEQMIDEELRRPPNRDSGPGRR
jgi:hypothetical protein